MLMNIAVVQGAEEGLKFIEYVEYLASNGFITFTEMLLKFIYEFPNRVLAP